MAEFTIQIAGRRFRVCSFFESTRDYCRKYLTEEAPDFTVTVTRQEMQAEQAALDAEAVREGLRRRIFTDPFLERSVIQRKVAEALLPERVVLLHGSAVAVDGEGYLFTADCGTGKSTHTRNWCQCFGSRAVMINDDKPFLRIGEGKVWVSGSPWSGKHGLDSSITVPLKGICLLTRGRENRICPAAPAEVLPMLYKQSGLFLTGEAAERYGVLVEALCEAVPLWKLQCTKEPEAARMAHRAMSEG